MKSWGTSAGLTVCGVFGLLGLLLLARSSDTLFARPASRPGALARLAQKTETIP
jgi:hypothetical protein